MALRVETHISGSRCVIWRTKEHYIDVRKTPRCEIAECVRNGHVYRRVPLSLNTLHAAEEVIVLIREELL